MKVLLVNDCPDRMRISDFYLQAFQDIGSEVEVLDLYYAAMDRDGFTRAGAPQVELAAGRLAKRFLRRAWTVRNETGLRLLQRAGALQPELIVFVGNIEVPLDLLRELKRRWPDCVLGNLLMEPFPVGNSLLRSAVPLYDCIFTFSKFQVAQLYWFQAQKVVWLPFGMAPAVHHRVAPTAAEQARFGSAVAYMGTWQPHVELWLEPLAGQDLKIWGNQWYRSAGHAQLVSKWQGEGAGLYQDMAKIVGASRVIFNMVRFHNGNGHSMKTFEIPACGGFMLTNRTDEQLEFFAEDEGAAYYSTTAELLDKLKFYLGHDTARSRIAERGHQLAQQHSYAARARQILDVQRTIISR
jgi:hypothetical protein